MKQAERDAKWSQEAAKQLRKMHGHNFRVRVLAPGDSLIITKKS